MSYTDTLLLSARRVMVTQAVVMLVLATGFGWQRGWNEALAALYGGMITILITAWLAWRLRRLTAQTTGTGLALIYSSAAYRYLVAATLVAVGVGLLRLAPMPLLVSFALTQFGFLTHLIARPYAKKQTKVN